MYHRNAGAVVLKLAYGWTVHDSKDRFVTLMEDAFVVQSHIVKPGKWLVDVFPICEPYREQICVVNLD